jgi:hypothetical protein
VARILPGVEVRINKDAQPDKRSYRVNFDLFKKLAPDHQPMQDLDSSIAGLRDGLQALNFKDDNFRQSQFMRLVQLNYLREKGYLTEDLQWAQLA